MLVKRWRMPFLVLVLLCGAGAPIRAEQTPLVLAAPDALRETGVLKYLLPRFRFKKRISVSVVAKGAAADATLTTEAQGPAVFLARKGGVTWHLRLPAEGSPTRASALAFRDWLRSKPGRAAIESFPPGGASQFEAAAEQAAVVKPLELTGNVDRGHQLARRDCMRCHVVDKQSLFAGIDSTPSFAALRTYPDWHERFQLFWTANPHRALITVTDMSEEKDPLHPVTIAPIVLSPDNVEDLVAYVATIAPADLGNPIAQD